MILSQNCESITIQPGCSAGDPLKCLNLETAVGSLVAREPAFVHRGFQTLCRFTFRVSMACWQLAATLRTPQKTMVCATGIGAATAGSRINV